MGWEHHCDKEDFVELTRKYDERKILLIMDYIDQLQEFIAAAHGRFPRQFVIHPDMSEEQMKENQLHHFWDKRTRWEHHCNKEDFVELKRMWNSKKRTSTTNMNNLKQLQEFIAAAHGRFPTQFDKQQELSEEQKKEKKLYYFWRRRTKWKPQCAVKDFEELTRKYGQYLEQLKILIIVDNLKQLQEFIAAAHGSFPQFVIHPNMSEEQKKEKQLFHFWLNRKQWEHHCNKEDFVELTRMWKNKKKNKVEGQESSKAEAINLPLYE